MGGREPLIIPNTTVHPFTNRLPITKKLNIGSYIGVPIMYRNGDMYGTLCVLDAKPYDFTPHDAKTLERFSAIYTHVIELEKEKNFSQLILDTTPNLVFSKDWNGKYTMANKAVGRLYGSTKKELIGQTDYDFTASPEEIEGLLRGDREVMETQKEKQMLEETVTDIEGNVRWFQTIKIPLINTEEKDHRQVLGIATDITERKKMEEQLLRSERLYRGLVESQQDMIVRMDSNHRFTFVNDACCKIFGMNREELLGQSIVPAIHRDDLEETLKMLKELEKSTYRAFIVHRVKTVDGWRWFSWEASAIKNDAGETQEIQGVARDITELKEAQQKAEDATTAKSEFLAVMSHDIRTPMNAIMGFAEVLQETSLTEEQSQYVKLIHRSNEHLMFLINQLLELSRIESGDFELEYSDFDTRDVVKDCLDFIRVRANKKGLDLICEIDTDLPRCVVGDVNRIRQILINVIDNAIKYTEHGKVQVSAECVDQKQSGTTIRFSVTDTGKGIPKDELDHVFKKFHQINTSYTTNSGGVGLGLAICNQLAKKMNGVLDIQSMEGQGTTISLTLELGIVDVNPADKRQMQDQVDMLHIGDESEQAEFSEAAGADRIQAPFQAQILVAEDNEDNRLLIQAFFKNSAYTITFAENGMEAIRAFKKQTFDAILMDMQMPIMDGYTAVREIRKIEEHHEQEERIPIIAVTAYATAGDREKCLQAGCDDYVAKPLKKLILLKILTKKLTNQAP